VGRQMRTAGEGLGFERQRVQDRVRRRLAIQGRGRPARGERSQGSHAAGEPRRQRAPHVEGGQQTTPSLVAANRLAVVRALAPHTSLRSDAVPTEGES